MKNRWILQSNGFKSSYLFEILDTLKRFDIDFKDFGVFNDGISNLSEILDCDVNETNFITRGGTKFLSILEKLKLKNRDLSYLDNKLPKEIVNNSSCCYFGGRT